MIAVPITLCSFLSWGDFYLLVACWAEFPSIWSVFSFIPGLLKSLLSEAAGRSAVLLLLLLLLSTGLMFTAFFLSTFRGAARCGGRSGLVSALRNSPAS